MIRKILLACGILAALLYVGSDIYSALRWEGYSYIAQPVSALRGIGAPTRALLIPILTIYMVLEIAFALGVWAAANGKRMLRITGGLLLGLGVVDFVAPFFPMNVGEDVGALTNTMHIILTGVTVLLIFLIIGFGAFADGKRFRFYSFATLLIVIVFGALSGMEGARFAAEQPAPWLGLTERINIYGYMLWLMMLAITLLRQQGTQPQANVGARPPQAPLPQHG